MNKIAVHNTPSYKILRLPSGLRCVLSYRPGVTYCGVAIGAGSRCETPGTLGLAHFVEHTIFKGTTHRRSHHISQRMESVGGELNAYTTKEETLIYTVAPRGYVERAVELLADLILCCNFPPNELQKEKEVVIDEINSYLDSPSEAIFDEFEDLIYAGSRLGHNILGTPDSVRALTHSDCMDFVHTHYRADNMVLYCVGEIDYPRTERMIAKYFGALTEMSHPTSLQTATPEIVPRFQEVREMGLHQCHTLMGTRIFGRNDSRRYALFLLNNYLGGPNMNSVFNRELRDKRGYVYTVDSMVALLSDCGLFQIYYGCDREDISKCRMLILREIQKLAESPMKRSVFEAARRQYMGQLQVAASYGESQAMNLGKSLLYWDRINDSSTTQEALMKLQPEDLTEVAQLIYKSGLSSLSLC